MATYRYLPDTAFRRRLARLIRRFAGCTGKPYPIVLVDETSPPRLEGRGFYYTTPSGKTVVNHPSAYGWPTHYHASTLRVEVGVRWAHRAGLFLVAVQRVARRLRRERTVKVSELRGLPGCRFDSEGCFRAGPASN